MTGMKLVMIVMMIGLSAMGQTNVSGGIYSNTTWTAIGSPYIILDSVVVFPGITLTIQPGVTVKFKHLCGLEIRQSTINAIGTETDSVTFTADTVSPIPGFWNSINLNGSTNSVFNYCNFYYGNIALIAQQSGTLSLKNSIFNSNQTGINAFSCSIDTCIFSNNILNGLDNLSNSTLTFCVIVNDSNGINQMHNSSIQNCLIECNRSGIAGTSGGATVTNSIINYNSIGGVEGLTVNINNCIIDSNHIAVGGITSMANCELMYNQLGFLWETNCVLSNNRFEYDTLGVVDYAGYSTGSFVCNTFCNNVSYDFQLFPNSTILNVQNNYWCTTDTTSIHAKIPDYYFNNMLPIAIFTPFYSTECNNVGPVPFSVPNYISPCNSNSTSVSIINNKENTISLIPNPFTTTTTLTLQGTYNNPSLFIYNLLGQEVRSIPVGTNKQITINREQLSSGMYFYKVMDENKEILSIGKMILE